MVTRTRDNLLMLCGLVGLMIGLSSAAQDKPAEMPVWAATSRLDKDHTESWVRDLIDYLKSRQEKVEAPSRQER
jgi:hypothetical protein